MKSAEQFIKDTMGKAYDVDGAYGAQCWDYVSGVYFPYIGGKTISCNQTKYVKDIANGRYWNGILDFCDDIGFNTILKKGDIGIWTNCPACPYSHIAIFDYDYGSQNVYWAGQNQPRPYVTVAKIPLAGLIGIFRPKIFADEKPGDEPKPTKDQVLNIGSKVISDTFEIERFDYGRDLGYSSKVGGWFPLADVDEVEGNDGKLDQIVHIGSRVQFNKGTMTVTGMTYGNIVTVDKLPYMINADCLIEVEV